MHDLPPEIARKIQELVDSGDYMGATLLEQRFRLYNEGWDEIRREKFRVLGNKDSLLSWRGALAADADYYPLMRSYPFELGRELAIIASSSNAASASIPPLYEADTGAGSAQYFAFGESTPLEQSDPFGFATMTQCAQTFINCGSLGPSTGPVDPREDDINNTMGFGLGYYPLPGNMPIGSAANTNPYIQIRARFGSLAFWQLAYNRGGTSTSEVTASFTSLIPSLNPNAPEFRRLQRLSILWEPSYGVGGRIVGSVDGKTVTITPTAATKPDFSGQHTYGLTFFTTSGTATADALTEIIIHNAQIQAFPAGNPGSGP